MRFAIASFFTGTNCGVVGDHVRARRRSMHPGEPVRLFTDGLWDSGASGAGAVLVAGRAATSLVAEACVPQVLLELWQSQGRVQLISQLESPSGTLLGRQTHPSIRQQ